MIPESGWCLNADFSDYDAELRFDVDAIRPKESPLCIAGEILQGLKKPFDCAAFAKQCTPDTPLGATMVSSVFLPHPPNARLRRTGRMTENGLFFITPS